MRVIPINWTDLETAFERNSPDTESFLDTRTGEVVSVTEGAIDYPEQRAKVQAAGEAFVRIEPAASREQYKWMERFVVGVTDEPLRERLVIAIDGKGAFRRFKDVLLNYPTERERWFSYRAELLHWAMHKWLEKEQLAPKEAAPWGTPKPPPEENVQLERPASASGEGPGEILRRQAKELIDLVPAVELPAAIAFLDFLRERGVAELGRVRTIPVKRTAA
ncbi:MAG TPA: UPF0158 family protein [Polyangia bacterium]|jgi:hypothetical protein|nr:UPF0158 family protein [Polyangia bacterium]